MRGVVSAGMVSALEERGMTGVFDAVYGSSAGAINAAYFLAGQARMGTTIYYEDINNRRFIDLGRSVRGLPVVDLGFLVDEVAVRTKPLDCQRVIASPSRFTVMATDVEAACRAPLRDFSDGPSLLGALRAGATMPVLAGSPVRWRDREYLDASLTEPIPVPLAEADGHSHLLVLLTRPSEMPTQLSPLDRWFVLPRLQRLSPRLAELYRGRGGPYGALLADIAAGRGPGGTARVLGRYDDVLGVHRGGENRAIRLHRAEPIPGLGEIEGQRVPGIAQNERGLHMRRDGFAARGRNLVRHFVPQVGDARGAAFGERQRNSRHQRGGRPASQKVIRGAGRCGQHHDSHQQKLPRHASDLTGPRTRAGRPDSRNRPPRGDDRPIARAC